MTKALVLKELRESAGVVAVAALALAYCYYALTRTEPSYSMWSRMAEAFQLSGGLPFVEGTLMMCLAVIGGGLALLLGLKQTAWELNYGTYYFLLHRPIPRSQIFVTKLVVGAIVVVGMPTLMILAYAWWAATPGNSPTPFFWSMILPCVRVSLVLTIIYLAAFLSGIRPARWFGTRLLPLVCGMTAALFAAAIPWYWPSVAVAVVSVTALLVGILYFVENRDY